MRLAYRTVSFRKLSLYKSLDLIASMGYQGVEICLDYHHLSERAGKGNFGRIITEAEERGLEVSSFSDHGNLLDDENFFRLKKAIGIAPEIGVAVFIVSSAPGKDRGRWHSFVERFDLLLEIAGDSLKIAIEPEPGLIVEGSEDFDRLKRNLNNGRILCMNLDIGHAHCMNEPLDLLLQRYHNEIVHFHIEDIAGRIHKHLVPGEGEIDFPSVLEKLERWYPEKFLAIDLFDTPDPISAAGRAIEVLGPLVDRT